MCFLLCEALYWARPPAIAHVACKTSGCEDPARFTFNLFIDSTPRTFCIYIVCTPHTPYFRFQTLLVVRFFGVEKLISRARSFLALCSAPAVDPGARGTPCHSLLDINFTSRAVVAMSYIALLEKLRRNPRPGRLLIAAKMSSPRA